MHPIQYVLIAIIVIIILKTFQKYRTRAITVREFFLWSVFWMLVLSIVLFPNATQSVADLVGVGRGTDLIVYLALVLLFFSLFQILLRIERIERDITKIVRKMALDEKGKDAV